MVCLKSRTPLQVFKFLLLILYRFLQSTFNPGFNNMVFSNFPLWSDSSAVQMHVIHWVVCTFFLFILFYDKLEVKLEYFSLCWLVIILCTNYKSIVVKYCTYIVWTNYNLYKDNIQIIICAIVCVETIINFL